MGQGGRPEIATADRAARAAATVGALVGAVALWRTVTRVLPPPSLRAAVVAAVSAGRADRARVAVSRSVIGRSDQVRLLPCSPAKPRRLLRPCPVWRPPSLSALIDAAEQITYQAASPLRIDTAVLRSSSLAICRRPLICRVAAVAALMGHLEREPLLVGISAGARPASDVLP